MRERDETDGAVPAPTPREGVWRLIPRMWPTGSNESCFLPWLLFAKRWITPHSSIFLCRIGSAGTDSSFSVSDPVVPDGPGCGPGMHPAYPPGSVHRACIGQSVRHILPAVGLCLRQADRAQSSISSYLAPHVIILIWNQELPLTEKTTPKAGDPYPQSAVSPVVPYSMGGWGHGRGGRGR